MAKDPAFLFYPNDWLGGTMYLSRHQKGCYIDLLIAQFNNGALSSDTIKTVLGQDQAAWTVLQSKFKQTAEGLWYNEKLLTEIEKRKSFCNSRRENIKNRYSEKSTSVDTSVLHTLKRMENGNENRNRIKKRIVKEKKFTPPTLDEFKAYWKENGYQEDIGERAWKGYSEADWHDSKGSPVKNWKQKCQNVWFKDEHKAKQPLPQSNQRNGIFKKAVKVIPESLCIIYEDDFSSRCTPQEAQQFKEGIIDISYFDKEF